MAFFWKPLSVLIPWALYYLVDERPGVGFILVLIPKTIWKPELPKVGPLRLKLRSHRDVTNERSYIIPGAGKQ